MPPHPDRYPTVRFKRTCITEFLQDPATSRAVVCTAGFTLISEALYLGKPLLAVPNRGIFEQTINGLFLEREGLGKAVVGRSLATADLQRFQGELDAFSAQLQSRRISGNTEAIKLIESVLARAVPTLHAFSKSDRHSRVAAASR